MSLLLATTPGQFPLEEDSKDNLSSYANKKHRVYLSVLCHSKGCAHKIFAVWIVLPFYFGDSEEWVEWVPATW